jgi:hypothetical protein
VVSCFFLQATAVTANKKYKSCFIIPLPLQMNIFAMMIKDKQPNGIKVLDDVTEWQNLQFLWQP